MRLLPATKSTFKLELEKRIPLLRNVVSQLIIREQIITSPARADAIRPICEMLIKNAKLDTKISRTENEKWTDEHHKVMPLLYGPLRTRYQKKESGFTRTYNILHTHYRHAPKVVIELVDGPKDTIKLLEKYKPQLELYKEKNRNIFTQPNNDSLIQGLYSEPNGRMDKKYATIQEQRNYEKLLKSRAGREKAKFIMTAFANKATGNEKEINQNWKQKFLGIK
jgi:ribosomal protein L17